VVVTCAGSTADLVGQSRISAATCGGWASTSARSRARRQGAEIADDERSAQATLGVAARDPDGLGRMSRS
jgi:hypothetical protein